MTPIYQPIVTPIKSSSFTQTTTLYVLATDIPVFINQLKMMYPFDVWDHVSYGGPRPIHRPTYQWIHRSMLDQYSTDVSSDTRLRPDRVSAGVGQRIDRDTVGGICRWYVGQPLVKYRSTVGQVSVDHLSIYGPIHRPILDRYHSTICHISVDTRYVYRLIL